MADTYETFGQDVQQEAAQELIKRKSQQFLFVVVGGIAPTKRDLSVSKGKQAMIRDGHAMSVTTEVAKHLLRASKRTFCIDHPMLSEHWPEPGREDFRLSKELQASVEVEPAILKSAFESFVELAAKDAAEHLDGKKEMVAWFDPAGVIGR
jgi:hypothetical protein